MFIVRRSHKEYEVINRIGTKGEVIAVDDIIATLEQENRQLHARNERLQKELDEALAEISRLKHAC
jgi:cell division protein FtsB